MNQRPDPGCDHGRSRRHRGRRSVCGALLSPECAGAFRGVFVIGDARVLQRALDVCGLTAHAAPDQRSAGGYCGITAGGHRRDAPGTAPIPLSCASARFSHWGGQAAFAAIRSSIDLVMGGRVDGVVTAPINKESLQAAKIPFIGHTEMFCRVYWCHRRNDDVYHRRAEDLLPDPAHVAGSGGARRSRVPKGGEGGSSKVSRRCANWATTSRIWRWPR